MLQSADGHILVQGTLLCLPSSKYEKMVPNNLLWYVNTPPRIPTVSVIISRDVNAVHMAS